MKPVLHVFTAGVFWLGWPVWFVYFRMHPNRTRAIVLSGGKLLLVRPWLGPGAWGLPGGGQKKSEAPLAAICRELREETGITVRPNMLEDLGKQRRRAHGLAYTAHFFLGRLDSTPAIRRQWYEIMDAAWFDAAELQQIRMDKDLQLALEKYGHKDLV